MTSPSPEVLQTACDQLSASDPALKRALDTTGIPAWRSVPPAYQSIARTIVYQQISTKAAANIWARLLNWANHDLQPHSILTAKENKLRNCGLSGPKIRHLTSIADAISSGVLDLGRLAGLSDQDARKQLISVRGIGPWTADIYLMGALGRLDPFPATDIGLIESLRLLQGAEARMSFKDFERHAEHWRPYRAVAAHILWGYLNHPRSSPQ